jgi:hypothetical protein
VGHTQSNSFGTGRYFVFISIKSLDSSLRLKPLWTTTGTRKLVLANEIRKLYAAHLADLSYRFWIKANNFYGLFESLPHHVATIKLSYIENFP